MHFQFDYFCSVATYDIVFFAVVRYIIQHLFYKGRTIIFLPRGPILVSQHTGSHEIIQQNILKQRYSILKSSSFMFLI